MILLVLLVYFCFYYCNQLFLPLQSIFLSFQLIGFITVINWFYQQFNTFFLQFNRPFLVPIQWVFPLQFNTRFIIAFYLQVFFLNIATIILRFYCNLIQIISNIRFEFCKNWLNYLFCCYSYSRFSIIARL